MDKVIEKARGKINLGLQVLGRRPDGYHEVRMIMQSIALCDELTISPGHGIELTTDAAGLSCGSDNLIFKAAALLAARFNITPNIHITLRKKIFLAAGLAGGSSDAAATLRGLNRYWGLGLDDAALEKLAAELGSDVPFCIRGGTALARGRGEIIIPLPDLPKTPLVLARPRALEVSTAWAYTNFDSGRVLRPPLIRNMAAAVSGGARAIVPFMGNVLETVTIPAHPQLALIKAAMLRAGAYFTMMSGSGPTVFALADTERAAGKIAAALDDFDVETAVTVTAGKEKV